VHHDIKPQNILFTNGDDIKLGDFGIANSDMGTRIYMPPEMFLGERLTKADPSSLVSPEKSEVTTGQI
jgi:serine/threonine protein kinase